MEKIYQVSTLQALSLGYSRSVVPVSELLRHGDTGLGTFEHVNGEMIVIDGKCYRATNTGDVLEAEQELGVPFASVAPFVPHRELPLQEVNTLLDLKKKLTLSIEEDFGLNSMHVVRIDGAFGHVSARSGAGAKAQHVSLKETLDETQKTFAFDQLRGSLVGVYYPDYMEGINAAGWHFHFISEDRQFGGHVFEMNLHEGIAKFCKIQRIEIQIPVDPAFDTYALKEASQDEIRTVEQGNGKQ